MQVEKLKLFVEEHTRRCMNNMSLLWSQRPFLIVLSCHARKLQCLGYMGKVTMFEEFSSPCITLLVTLIFPVRKKFCSASICGLWSEFLNSFLPGGKNIICLVLAQRYLYPFPV